jgi:PAS domain S-box-containing protein
LRRLSPPPSLAAPNPAACPGTPEYEATAEDPRRLWQAFVRRVGFMLALAGVLVFAYNFAADHGQIEEIALKRARAHFRDIVLTWHWNSDYGGVYVEKKPGVEANTFLEFPDVVSRDGKVYTLRDPDTMSREIAGLARSEGDHRFHITSLRLKNPDNLPDAWERQALESFDAGKTETFEAIRDGDRVLFRYMAPMRTEKACLTCHSEKAYKIGKIHGGISVSFDITDEVTANLRHQALTGLMILLAMGAVFFATRWFTRRLDLRLSQINRGYQELLAEKNAILQNAVVGIVFVRDRHIVSCNRRFEEIFGYGPNELTGQSTRELYGHPETFENIGRRAYPALAQGRKYSEEVVLRHRDGHAFWGAMTGQALDPEHPELGAIWIYADISRRREAMEEANKLRRAVEQSPVSILITNRDGDIEYVNPRFTQVTGYSRWEVIGKNPRVLNSGQMPREVFEDLWTTLLTGCEWRGQLLNRRKNGELFWEDASISPMVTEAGEISHFIAVKEDITLRKEAEKQQEQHQAQLEELVQKRTADLSQALDAARAADRTKNEFLANMSHEMRTPLNAVIGLSGLAMNSLTDPHQREYLEKIGHAGQTLLAIINDLLDLSKIAAGRLELESIPFSLPRLMERVGDLVSHPLAEKKLGLEVQIDPELPANLVGDPLRLEQILLNLLTNAIKFTVQGKIAVRFRQHSLHADRVGLGIEVEDTGVGLSAAEIERLFQPFSQADSSITRTHGGTGLGLTICRRLAELMGGSIGVTSTPGLGSTFRVQVDLGIADPASPARRDIVSAAPVDDIRYRDCRVLVADDQPVNRQIVHELLKQVGIDCAEASTGREALEAIQAHPAGWFDLVFMDIQMPEMDGHSASRAILALPGSGSLPIVAMTAHAMEHEKQASLAAGMTDHLGKPFSTDAFYRLLAKWIPAGHQYREGAPAAKPAAAAPLPAIDGVDTEAGLHRFAGNQAAYVGWLRKFDSEGEASLEEAVAALRAGSREESLRILHALKGRVGMLGLTALWEATVHLESALKEEREFETFLAALLQEFSLTRDRLRRALEAPAETEQ